MPARIVYTGGRLDRAGARRKDAAWVAAQHRHPDARVLPLWNDRCLVCGDSAARVAADPFGAVDRTAWVLLGVEDGAPLFAADLGADESARDAWRARAATAEASSEFAELRRVTPRLSADDAATLAYARGLLLWHRRARFCGVCGGAAESREGGHVRVCANAACGAEHYPRTDPAVIMLVEHRAPTGERRCLLAHHGRLVAGMFSTLAGFVEPGESLEEAVAREVFEETGVRVGAVRYRASQPWPFPASLMIAFRAEAESTEIAIDDDELTEARWFAPAELRAAGDPSAPDAALKLPRADSIARVLIEEWLAEVE